MSVVNPYESPCESEKRPYDFTLVKKFLLAIAGICMVVASCFTVRAWVIFSSGVDATGRTPVEIIRSFMGDWQNKDARNFEREKDGWAESKPMEEWRWK